MSEERDMEGQEPNTDGEQTLEQHDLSEEVLNELDENVQKSLKSYKAQKEHFQTKFQKEKEAREALEAKFNSLSAKEEEPTPKKKQKEDTTDAEWRERLEFMALNAGKIDPSDLEELSSIAKIKGIKLSEAMETDLYKGYLKVKEEKTSEANTVPTAGSDSPVVGKYSNFEKVKPEDISQMSAEDFQKYKEYLSKKS